MLQRAAAKVFFLDPFFFWVGPEGPVSEKSQKFRYFFFRKIQTNIEFKKIKRKNIKNLTREQKTNEIDRIRSSVARVEQEPVHQARLQHLLCLP